MSKKYISGTEEENGAKIITTRNVLREKVGYGGLDKVVLERADDAIKNNTIDFHLQAEELYLKAEAAIQAAQSKPVRDRKMIELICRPVMQLKSGGMFRYILLTRISSTILEFLDDRQTLNDEAFDILAIYLKIIKIILNGRLTGDAGENGRILTSELEDACRRYNKKFPLPVMKKDN